MPDRESMLQAAEHIRRCNEAQDEFDKSAPVRMAMAQSRAGGFANMIVQKLNVPRSSNKLPTSEDVDKMQKVEALLEEAYKELFTISVFL